MTKNQDNRIKILAVLFVLGFVLIVLIAQHQTAPVLSPKDNTAIQKTETPITTSPTQTTNIKGRYLDYDQAAFSQATGQRILFFHANWCPQCQKLDKSIKEGMLPDNMTIFKVDFDNQTDLRKKYAVTIQTTIVIVNENGDLIKKSIAYDNPSLDFIKTETANL